MKDRNRNSQWKRWGRLIEVLSVILVLFYYAGADNLYKMMKKYFPTFLTAYLPVGGVIVLIVFMGMLIALVRYQNTAFPIFRKTGFIWLFVLLAFLSASWSITRETTLRNSFILATTTGFGIIVSLRFRMEQQLQLLALVIAVIAFASLFVILLFPLKGTMSEFFNVTVLRGIYSNSNVFGKIMALGVLTFTFVTIRGRNNLLLSLSGMILCAFLILGSQSRTSMAAVMLCLLIFGFLTQFKKFSKGVPRSLYAALCFILGTSFGIWVGLNLKWVLQLVGTDITLNNRMMLWAALMEKAKHHLWIGYGYGAFWQGEKIGVSGEVTKAIGWYPFHAHNGFLDLLLDLGLVGLSAFLILIAIVFLRAYQIAITSPSQKRLDLWPLIYFIFFIGYNLAESDLFLPNRLMWFFFVTVTTHLLIRQRSSGIEGSKTEQPFWRTAASMG